MPLPDPAQSSPSGSSPSKPKSSARPTHPSHTPLSPGRRHRNTVQSTALSLATLAQRTPPSHASGSNLTLDFDGDDDYEMVQQYGAAQGQDAPETMSLP